MRENIRIAEISKQNPGKKTVVIQAYQEREKNDIGRRVTNMVMDRSRNGEIPRRRLIDDINLKLIMSEESDV